MYEVCKGEDLACSNEILNRMGQYSKVMDTVDNITKVYTVQHYGAVTF
jgi:hypothetical protein